MLLDSQVVVWALAADERLGEQALRSIQTSPRVSVSAASIWELTIKSMLGKLDLPADLSDVLEQDGFLLLDVTPAHAEGLRAFPDLVRHDPFDRLLVAQAHVERVPLLTADRVLLGLGREFIVDATQ